jgi:hypothetical protein
MDQGTTLLSSSRTFYLWKYGVGHSLLLLRSIRSQADDPVELLFEGVRSIHLDQLQFPNLEVYRSEDELLRGNKYVHPFLRIELRTPGHTGHVVCGRLIYIQGTYPTGANQWSVKSSLRSTPLVDEGAEIEQP